MNKSTLTFCTLVFLFTNSFNLLSQGISQQTDSLLSEQLEAMQTSIGMKSLSAAVQCSDGSVWQDASGISSQVPNVQAVPEMAYEIGSVTKTLTAACILQMADEDLLSLDDSLYEWIDTIEYINPNITIRQLLRHQSGLYDVLSNPDNQPALLADMDSIWEAPVLIEEFIGPPLFDAGDGWSYSNTNYFLLGMIIEIISGQPFYAELNERFFDPLALNTFEIPAFEGISSPVAHVWLDTDGNGVTQDAHYFYMGYMSLNSVAGAAGGYFATASDVTRWMRTYMRGDLVSEELMLEAFETVTAPGLPSATYGLGLTKKSFSGHVGYGHGGDLAYSASSWYFPDLDISITVLNNDADFISWELVPVVNALLEVMENNPCSVVGIEESFAENTSVKAWPNPFDNELSIALPSLPKGNVIEFTLTDLSGKMVRKEIVASGNELYVLDGYNELSAGIYLLDVSVAGEKIDMLRLAKS